MIENVRLYSELGPFHIEAEPGDTITVPRGYSELVAWLERNPTCSPCGPNDQVFPTAAEEALRRLKSLRRVEDLSE